MFGFVSWIENGARKMHLVDVDDWTCCRFKAVWYLEVNSFLRKVSGNSQANIIGRGGCIQRDADLEMEHSILDGRSNTSILYLQERRKAEMGVSNGGHRIEAAAASVTLYRKGLRICMYT